MGIPVIYINNCLFGEIVVLACSSSVFMLWAPVQYSTVSLFFKEKASFEQNIFRKIIAIKCVPWWLPPVWEGERAQYKNCQIFFENLNCFFLSLAGPLLDPDLSYNGISNKAIHPVIQVTLQEVGLGKKFVFIYLFMKIMGIQCVPHSPAVRCTTFAPWRSAWACGPASTKARWCRGPVLNNEIIYSSIFKGKR